MSIDLLHLLIGISTRQKLDYPQIASGNPYSLGVTGNGFWDPLNPLYIGENATYEESATALMNMAWFV